ncbi:MAG TPA: PspC domain-containing protein [Candidatus Limivivens intestinipullorum]|uniref:PspC domain-containing protein n=1 Tax=Candidatus Limivivens intestinipullorum TaxID=2840858 RepID=A0A9D1EQY1_9FIRM|nr:PspC domain-containing protein [Candidatus Limivivens intestinipullorum]
MSGKKLYKSDTNRMICGVCGGVGEYFNIDPTIVRLLFVFFGLTAAAGIIAYIIAAIIIPSRPYGGDY